MSWSDEYPLNLLVWITEKRLWFTVQANIHRRVNSLYFKVSKRQTSPGSHGSKLCTHHLGRCHLHAELISWAPWAQFIWIQPPWLVLILFVSPSKELCCLLTSKSDTLSLSIVRSLGNMFFHYKMSKPDTCAPESTSDSPSCECAKQGASIQYSRTCQLQASPCLCANNPSDPELQWHEMSFHTA